MIVFCNKIESIQKETTRYMLSLSLSLSTHTSSVSLSHAPYFSKKLLLSCEFSPFNSDSPEKCREWLWKERKCQLRCKTARKNIIASLIAMV